MRRTAPAVGMLIAATLAFAFGHLTARVGRVPPKAMVGETILNGDLTFAYFDVVEDPFISPTVLVEGVTGSECIVPNGQGQRVEVGVVPVAPVEDAAGSDVAVWVKCLSAPDRLDRWRLRSPDTTSPKELYELYPDLPQRGERVRYVGDMWLGSGSARLGVPDLAAGMVGRVLMPRGLGTQVIVEWQGGPTMAVPVDMIEPLGE